MKTIAEMKETVRQFLIENGFEQDNYFVGSDTYHFPGKAEIVNEMRYNSFAEKELPYSHYEGRSINVKELYRSNGTETNQSIEISVFDWHGNSGRRIFREKIYSRHGEKKTASVLAKVLEAYHN